MTEPASPQAAPVTEPPEIIYTDSHKIACEGSGGALGHPRVYLEMGALGRVECPYCDRLYVLKPDAAH